MKKNASRLIVFCAVMGFVLAGYDISFADTQGLNLEAAHYVPAAAMPVNGALTLTEQTSSTRQSAFEWVFLSAIVLGSLLIVWVLAFSASSMLPALPQVEAATARKQVALYDSGDWVKSSHPAPSKGLGIGDRFTTPYPRHAA
jgi:hypothetical protein